MPSHFRLFLFSLVAAAISLLPAPAHGQDRQVANSELLDDYRHYILTRQDTLAEASAVALLQRGLTAEEFVGLVEDLRFGVDGFETAVRKGLFIPSLESVSAKLEQLYQQGKRDKARNPDEIAHNISLLTGNQRGRLLAGERLRAAGEYSVPQLLQVLLARSNPLLESEAERVLVAMGADAIAPISSAILQVNPATQERLAVILGQTQHPAALALLYELAHTTSVDAVRSAAEQAIARISGSYNPQLPVSDLYVLLAEDYYDQSRSLTRFPGETHQLLWTFNPSLGLYATPIRTEIFHETRAMQLAERALEIQPDNLRATPLWIAANFRREIDTPERYTDPVYDPERRDALFYAVAAGPRAMQDVLSRAITDRDTPLARRAIQALRRSAGGAGLWDGLGGTKPLLDALSYPDRRVQYDAALALAAANPVEPFPGSDRIAPLLASAIRDAGARFAVVISRDVDEQQHIADVLRAAEGFEVLAPASSLTEAASAIAEAPGVDLLVVDGPTDVVEQVISLTRDDRKLRAAPILGVMPESGWADLHFRYEVDPLTEVRRRGISDMEFIEAVRLLVEEAAGPAIDAEQADRYAFDALAVLRDLAVGGSASITVSDATTPLIAALADTSGDIRLQVADVLARIGQKRAQVALMDAALKTSGDEQVGLLDEVTRSVKSFGNQLEPRHIDRLVELADASETSTATAAAALMGALNLQGGKILDLILAR